MKTAAFIIARLSSSRLPEKNLMPILGKPMIEHLIHRVRKSKLIDEVCIVTSNLRSDDKLEEFAKVNNIPCYRGSLDNIMERITLTIIRTASDTYRGVRLSFYG